MIGGLTGNRSRHHVDGIAIPPLRHQLKQLGLGYGAAMSFSLLAIIIGSTLLLCVVWRHHEQAFPILAGMVVALALVWTRLPVYRLLRMALLIPAEISSFPPPFLPHHPQP